MGKSKKTNKLLVAGISMTAAAVLLIGGGIFMLIKGNNEEVVTPGGFAAIGEEDSATACQNLMSEYYSAIMGENGESLYKLMAPPEYWTYYMETYGKTEEEVIATYSDAINNTKANWKAQCGDNAKVSFKIVSSGDQTEEFLQKWNDNMGSIVGSGELNAEEAVTLNVEQTVTGSGGSIETNNTPTLIKVNSKWYILDEGTGTNANSEKGAE